MIEVKLKNKYNSIMIDRNNIIEAAASKFNPTVGGLANTAERIAFEKGVDWFKHAIWHEAV